MKKTGIVYLVGAGPGDAGLLTVRARELILRADSVIYDRLVGEEILGLIPENANKIDVGKNAGSHPVPQEEIGAVLLREVRLYKTVVRLKGGDPFIFGRGGEEAEVLAAEGVPFEVVPGVTSAAAAPAYAGIPVTHRDFASSLHIITGHGRDNSEVKLDYTALVKIGGTLVFMMSVATIPEIAEGLIAAGMTGEMPAAVIENGTTPRQRSFTGTLCGLADIIKRENVKSPAVIVVGGVCGEANRLGWFTRRPLSGCRILVTRPREAAADFCAGLNELGAEVTCYPCIKTRPIEFEVRTDGADWVIFTSAVGVNAFFGALRENGRDARALGGVYIAAVGGKTANALKKYGITADFVPLVYDGAHLARALISEGRIKAGQKAVLFRAREGGGDIVGILLAADAVVEDVPVYETLFEDNEPVDPGTFHFAAFTSASCVRGFVKLNKTIDFTKLTAVCIGRQTAAAAREAGMNVTVSDSADTASMIEKIQEVWHEYKTKTAQSER